MQKFDVIWPKKVEIKNGKTSSRIERERYQQKRKEEKMRLAFNLIDLDQDGILSILDINWLCDNFGGSTKFGKMVHEILQLHMEKNVRPKYIKQKYIVDYSIFASLVP